MYIDPDAGLPFEQLLARIWQRQPDLHRRVLVIAERTGRSVESIVRECRARLDAILATDSPERDEILERWERTIYPFGLDPSLTPDKEDLQ